MNTDSLLQVWNTELETIAQRWADQCSFDHDEERCKEDGTDVSKAATKAEVFTVISIWRSI